MALRIAHIVQRMAPGGLEVIALELSRQLPGNHFLVSLEATTAELVTAWPRLEPMKARLFGLEKSPGLDFNLPDRLRRLFRELRIDSIVTHHAGPFIYASPAARLAGVRDIVHVEHDVWHYNSARRRCLMRMVSVLTRPRVVGVSEKLRAKLATVFGARSLQIIPNGVDVRFPTATKAEARVLLGIPEAARIVGAAGRLEWVKGHDILIAAMALLPADIVLVLAGDGTRHAALMEKATQTGVAGRIIFLGHRDDVRTLYPAFDVFCQPSRDEGLPLAVLEAQAAGIPVVATSVGDVAAAICPASGLLVPPEDPAALAAALAAILNGNNPASPRPFIVDRFNWNETIDAYARIIGV